MEHLTALDAAFLEVEDSDPHVSLAIGGLSIVEGLAPSHDELVAALADRVPTIPRCRQVLRTRPLDLGSAEWVDDPHFDISRHLHRVALPDPGGDAELFQLMATIMERRLDRERPGSVRAGEPTEAEVAVAVAHQDHLRGVATALLRRLRKTARGKGIRYFVADILAENSLMLQVLRDAGWRCTKRYDDSVLHIRIDLSTMHG